MCLEAAGVALLSYMLGSIPFSYLLAKVRGVDLTVKGSGNVGPLNVYRTTGSIVLAALALALDAAKGMFAAFLALLYFPTYAFLAPFFAVLGHNWPIWTRFRGGRGISVLLGASLYLQPTFIGVWAALWVMGYVISGYIAGGALLALLLTPGIHFQLFGVPNMGLLLALIPIWMKYMHKAKELASGRLKKHFWRVGE